MRKRTFYEFFAGGGMARLGLGKSWECLLANDIDPKKVANYTANFGGAEVVCDDIYNLKTADLPGNADLAWASFPCQDLSLAGNRRGLAGERSGAFWGFWGVINKLKAERRAPSLLVLENVIGALTSHGGKDFREIAQALASLGYDFGAVIIDAVHFLPQSRPRLFIVCVERGRDFDPCLIAEGPLPIWHNGAVVAAAAALPPHLRAAWRWWRLPPPPSLSLHLHDVLEPDHSIDNWHTEHETTRLLRMMSSANADKVKEARRGGKRIAGTLYKRTRLDGSRERVQRAETRFDGIAGCLRTPGGGSSRQIVMIVEGNETRSRLLTVREAANLMGVPETYRIPSNYNEGYHIFGDGLAVPAVEFLRSNLLDDLCAGAERPSRSAA